MLTFMSCTEMDLTVLPKLNAVILDPESKWNGHPKISLEFKKFPSPETNLTGIYDALKLLSASYEFREISYEQGFAYNDPLNWYQK